MPVGVAHVVSCSLASPAAIANFSHSNTSLVRYVQQTTRIVSRLIHKAQVSLSLYHWPSQKNSGVIFRDDFF